MSFQEPQGVYSSPLKHLLNVKQPPHHQRSDFGFPNTSVPGDRNRISYGHPEKETQ